MRTRWLGGLALCVGLAALPQAGAQTPEIQNAVEARLAEAKPAPKSDDKAEAKPRLRAEAKPAPKGDDKAEAKPRFVAAAIDYEDFVFVASDRPVLVRLHMRNNGRPYSAAWDEYMKKFFTYFDKNGDGTLDKAEAERAPNMQFLRFHLQGNIGFPYQGQTVPMAQMDTSKDGKVSAAEFADYYRRSGFIPLQFSNSSSQANTNTVTNTLLKYLDANKDGKLSAEEVAKGPKALQRLDLDEDEMIATAELTPGGGNNLGYAVSYGGTGTRKVVDLGFIQVKAATVDGVAQQVLAHYDKNKNGKLSRDEVALEDELFDRLDANRDDQLDAKEFAGFFRRDADLELMGRIGKLEAKEIQVASFLRKIGLGSQPVRAEVFNPSKRTMPLTSKVRRHNPSGLVLELGDAHIALSVAEQQFGQNGNLQFYARLFKQADTGKKGAIDRKQAKTVQFLDEIFPLFDRDGDGKLTLKELNAYLAMQAEGSGCQMQLSISDEGRSLFEILDANGDGRLSVRELRSGWSRMKPLAKSAKGLSRLDIPRRLSVSVGQAQRFRVAPPARVMGGSVVSASNNGAPLWFSKMDRNRDGDLSPREFIGTVEDFRKLDADGDGLISAEEARQFETRLKKEKQQKH